VAWLPRVAWALLAAAVFVNEVFIARFLSSTGTLAWSTVMEIRILQAGLFLTGLSILLFQERIPALVRRLMVRQRSGSDVLLGSNGTLFVLALFISWLALIMVVEAGYHLRFFWLWPLQMVLIIAAVTYLPQRLGWRPSVAWFAQISITLILLTHPWVISPVRTWMTSGWAGSKPHDIQALDYIATELRSQGRDTVALGYQTHIAGFMAAMNIVDSRYKVGAELDLFLKHRHGISNSNQCAEGVSPHDEYRIVQHPSRQVGTSETTHSTWGPIGSEVKTHRLSEYISVPLDPGFDRLRQFGDFHVFRRTSAVPFGEFGSR
jgi:hypothetical protein